MTTSGFSSMIFSSSALNGAYSKSEDGSSFSVDLDNGAIIPRGATSAYVSVEQAFVYNNVSNISTTSSNNKIYVRCNRETSAGGGQDDYTLTIPDGLYNPNTLNNELKYQMDNSTIDTSVDYPFGIGFNTNNKIVIGIKDANCKIYFTDTDDNGTALTNNELREMLGFAKIKLEVPAGSNTPYAYTSTNLPKFNIIEFFLIACDFVQGIAINQKQGGYLAQVPISAEPGLQIIHEPTKPFLVSCSRLIGNTGNKSFRFRLLDHLGRPVNTNGEEFSFRLKFEWYM